jgi:hypothetical protein
MEQGGKPKNPLERRLNDWFSSQIASISDSSSSENIMLIMTRDTLDNQPHVQQRVEHFPVYNCFMF